MASNHLETQIHGPIAVIGDVHGQIEKLSVVLNRLRGLPNFEHRWVVFIGDLVDRGPNPKQAIDMALELRQQHRRTTAIMGNHEFAMCSALGWLPAGDVSLWSHRWVDYYNSETTFASYGASAGDVADLAAKVPDEHRDFLTSLPWCVEHPHLFFVHAGLDPHLPFSLQHNILRQKDFSLTRPSWLCEKTFVAIDPPADCPFTVVSGHVRVEEVAIRPRRILVDTTGGEGGDLSCVLMPERMVITSNPAERAPTIIATDSSSKASSGSSNWWKIWG